MDYFNSLPIELFRLICSYFDYKLLLTFKYTCVNFDKFIRINLRQLLIELISRRTWLNIESFTIKQLINVCKMPRYDNIIINEDYILYLHANGYNSIVT